MPDLCGRLWSQLLCSALLGLFRSDMTDWACSYVGHHFKGAKSLQELRLSQFYNLIKAEQDGAGGNYTQIFSPAFWLSNT